MFLKVVTELPVDYREVRAMLLDQPGTWLRDMLAAIGDQSDRPLAEVGLGAAGPGLAPPPSVAIGDAVLMGRVVLVPFRMCFDGHLRRLDPIEGSLDAAWLGRGHTYLALTASYEPPMRSGRRAPEEVLFHRLMEILAQRLVESVAHEMVGRSAARTDVGGWPPLLGALMRHSSPNGPGFPARAARGRANHQPSSPGVPVWRAM
jgi:hypothetical protein